MNPPAQAKVITGTICEFELYKMVFTAIGPHLSKPVFQMSKVAMMVQEISL
jgi:hypothetical protein